MKSIHFAPRFVLPALLALAAACSDAPVSPERLPVLPSAAVGAGPERAALDELTLAVAKALNDPGLRHRVKADLRASRVTVEHKLRFSEYLHGESGGILLAAMAKEAGKSRDELLALLGSVRPLEFYMPVQEHRERWTGGPDLYVGSLVQDHTKPTVFDLAGRPVDVPVDAAPALPTLALVPVETDFSRPLSPKRYRNRNDRGGQTIGTYEIAPCSVDSPDCNPECPPDALDCTGSGGGGYTPPAIPRGLYYVGADLKGVGEGGLKGKPEIEVWVIRTYDPNKSYLVNEPAFPRCQASETHSGARYFNQDAEYWSGRALVLDSAQAATLEVDESSVNAAPHGYSIQLWEDDSDPCELRTTIDMNLHIGELSTDRRNVFEAPKTATGGRTVGPVYIQYPDIIEVWNALTGYNDEYLGIAIDRASAGDVYYPGYTHILFRDRDVRNGAIKLEFR